MVTEDECPRTRRMLFRGFLGWVRSDIRDAVQDGALKIELHHAESEVHLRNKNETESGAVSTAIPRQSLSPVFEGYKQSNEPTGQPIAEARSSRIAPYEFIDSGELARRWDVPVSWIRDQVR